MPLYRPSELQNFLREWGFSARKSCSQNFLIDGNVVQKIVALAEPDSNTLVLEIGPGPGVLTELILEKGAHVLAVELDRGFAEALPRLDKNNQLTVIQEDVMKVDLRSTLKQKMAETGATRCVAVSNTPYHLSTAIVEMLLPLRDIFENLVLMVQKELAHRATAKAGTEHYGRLSLFLELHSDCKLAFHVSKHCFYPRPKVESSILNIRPKASGLTQEQELAIEALMKAAFGQRRKTLQASLKETYPNQDISQSLTSIGKDPKIRPEQLCLQDFIDLLDLLQT